MRFHSENSEICAHPPRPEFRISMLQIKGGGRLRKDVKFSNFLAVKQESDWSFGGTCQFKYFLSHVQRSDFKQRFKQIVVIECQCTIREVPKEKILTPIWGESVHVYAVCVERICKNMKWIHKEPFHLFLLQPSVGPFILIKIDSIKSKETNDHKLNNGTVIQ